MSPAPDLFRHASERSVQHRPLADLVRPNTLEDIVGHSHLLGQHGPLRRLVEQGQLASWILSGPPGCGKTTLARAIAHTAQCHSAELSAVNAGLKELRLAIQEARRQRDHHNRPTILFIDEIHRYSKTQQDALLPHLEAGDVFLIGATTESPFATLNAALLSRCHIQRLEAHSTQSLQHLLKRALKLWNEQCALTPIDWQISSDFFPTIAHHAQGDARIALNLLEAAIAAARQSSSTTLSLAELSHATQHIRLPHGRNEHYELISAFIKSMRASDPQAANYWLLRLIEGGEDVEFIVRRMIVFASEDIGNAAPQALAIACHTLSAVQAVGMPEARYALIQTSSYLAQAPKSRATCSDYATALSAVEQHGALPVPNHLLPATARRRQNARPSASNLPTALHQRT